MNIQPAGQQACFIVGVRYLSRQQTTDKCHVKRLKRQENTQTLHKI